jgi:hypothetical protein
MSRKRAIVAVCVGAAGLIGGSAFSWAQPGRERSAAAPAYRVTDWPDNLADKSYSELVEGHLNQMAEQGFKLNSTVFAQGARMMIFERREADQP